MLQKREQAPKCRSNKENEDEEEEEEEEVSVVKLVSEDNRFVNNSTLCVNKAIVRPKIYDISDISEPVILPEGQCTFHILLALRKT
jgi:hypothetical protein